MIRHSSGLVGGLPRTLAVALVAMVMPLHAFPPAPHHTLYGIVRDQVGNPLTASTARVILTAASGTQVSDLVLPNLRPGANYQLEVPMDAGFTSALYLPTALLPAAPFKMSVQIGDVSYVPIEMKGDYALLGQPGESTHLDLTLGVDADRDGLPDAWEQAAFQQLGRVWRPGALRPGDLFPGTGLTFAQVYLAGTYTYAPKDGFVLNLMGMADGKAQLAFTAVKGRSYTIQAAAELGSWSTVGFRLSTDAPAASTRQYFQALSTAKMNIEVPPSGQGEPARFYRLLVE